YFSRNSYENSPANPAARCRLRRLRAGRGQGIAGRTFGTTSSVSGQDLEGTLPELHAGEAAGGRGALGTRPERQSRSHPALGQRRRLRRRVHYCVGRKEKGPGLLL